MKPETALTSRIMDTLRAQGGWWMKVHGGGFQVAGVPDIIGCYKGRFVAIEVKVGDNTPTQLQVSVLLKLSDAGALVGVARSVEGALLILRGGEYVRKC
jgi:Holliday junction resolvase